MNRPYVSRRSRRCAAGALCVHGGRIRPGEVVVRGKQQLYVHSDDDEALDRVLEAISALTAKLPVYVRCLSEAILITGEAVAQAGPWTWYPPLNVGIVRDSVLNTRNDVGIFSEHLTAATANDCFLTATTNLATPEAIQRAREHYTRPLRWVPPVEPVYDFAPLPPAASDVVWQSDPDEPEWHDAMRLDASSKAAADEIAAWNELLGR